MLNEAYLLAKQYFGVIQNVNLFYSISINNFIQCNMQYSFDNNTFYRLFLQKVIACFLYIIYK